MLSSGFADSDRILTPPNSTARPAILAWLTAGALGLFLLLAPILNQQTWLVNRAGTTINKTNTPAGSSEMQSLLASLERDAGEGGSASFWRTYGAAATRYPSERAFRTMLAARDRGEIDRIGQLWLGEVASATGHWREAQQAYERVDAANLLLARGDAARDLERRDAAVNWYRLAAASVSAAVQREVENPADSGGRRSSRLVSGVATGSEAGSLSPGERAVLLLRIGQGFLALDVYDEAVTALEKAITQIKINPPAVRACQSVYYTLANALLAKNPDGSPLKTETRDRVENLVQEALKLDGSGWANLQAGRIQQALGDKRQAIASLRRATQLDPGLPDAYLVLGQIYRADGVPSLARDLFEQGSKKIPGNQELLDAWAKMAYLTCPPEESLPLLLRAIRSQTSDPYVYAFLGDCYLSQGLIDDARAAYRQGLNRFPGSQLLIRRHASLPRPTGMRP